MNPKGDRSPKRPPKRGPSNKADLRSMVQKANRRHQKFVNVLEKCHSALEFKDQSEKEFDFDLWEDRVARYLKVEEIKQGGTPRNPR